MTDPQKQQAAPTSARAITCPSCGGSIGIKAAGYTVSVACLYCGTVLDVAGDNVRVIAEYHQAVAKLDIPLGTRGALFGVEWEAIGWLERSGAGAAWQEYLLFNPYAGYRWLVLSEGQWQFGTMLTDRPETVSNETVVWRGNPYELDDEPYRIVTRRVLGEFYWRVRAGDQVDAASFARGQEQLSCEWNPQETQWTQMVPIAGRKVGEAFGLTGKPGPKGKGGTKPAPGPPPGGYKGWSDRPFSLKGDVRRMFGWGLAALVVMLAVMATLSGDRAGISGTMVVVIDGPVARGEYGPVTVTRASQMLTIHLDGPGLINEWADMKLSLVNRATHQAIPGVATLESYSGSDSDGSWTSGDHAATLHLYDVPRGSYNLLIEGQGHSWHDPNDPSSAQSTVLTPALLPGLLPDSGKPFGADEKLLKAEEVTFAVEDGGVDWPLWWTCAVLIMGVPCVILIIRVSRGGRR
ncbi:DUF4178 domain-containing protein [Novosphingobium rosa]|uniref:DUF4178 domain-containing protein n=1 Tax=Novosphingobium rosa TaxID=76978 RepID=UPI000833F5DD|nr:DUF4178 domain-containing protein [Novosphingobium rosa]